MTVRLPIAHFSPEQRELWDRVNALWELSRLRDAGAIQAALHPRYVGWDMNGPLPHDRDAAVQSVSGEAGELLGYELRPLSVEVYGGQVGVAHYAYSAEVATKGEPPVSVTGRWTEVYLKQDGEWTMVSVSGRPDLT